MQVLHALNTKLTFIYPSFFQQKHTVKRIMASLRILKPVIKICGFHFMVWSTNAYAKLCILDALLR